MPLLVTSTKPQQQKKSCSTFTIDFLLGTDVSTTRDGAEEPQAVVTSFPVASYTTTAMTRLYPTSQSSLTKSANFLPHHSAVNNNARTLSWFPAELSRRSWYSTQFDREAGSIPPMLPLNATVDTARHATNHLNVRLPVQSLVPLVNTSTIDYPSYEYIDSRWRPTDKSGEITRNRSLDVIRLASGNYGEKANAAGVSLISVKIWRLMLISIIFRFALFELISSLYDL